jgi:hypothetical protein
LTDDIADKVMQAAHQRAITAAMTYLHQHAGYTRVHNPLTGVKELQRLPGLVAIAYQHETSRCGDPHLHTQPEQHGRRSEGGPGDGRCLQAQPPGRDPAGHRGWGVGQQQVAEDEQALRGQRAGTGVSERRPVRPTSNSPAAVSA